MLSRTKMGVSYSSLSSACSRVRCLREALCEQDLTGLAANLAREVNRRPVRAIPSDLGTSALPKRCRTPLDKPASTNGTTYLFLARPAIPTAADVLTSLVLQGTALGPGSTLSVDS